MKPLILMCYITIRPISIMPPPTCKYKHKKLQVDLVMTLTFVYVKLIYGLQLKQMKCTLTQTDRQTHAPNENITCKLNTLDVIIQFM